MESLQSAVQLIQKDYWMAVLDLKDAYYSVPINPQHRKYLRFEFKDTHVLQLLRSQPLEIKMLKSTLRLPFQPEEVHPLYPKLHLHGCPLSGLP